MAIGPRLDLRQSQTLVMTPQLRQAIKLLQFSNIEVGAFVEEELERNPLLERDERDQGMPPNGPRRIRWWAQRTRDDAAEMARSEILPTEAASPLDMGDAETYDAGGAADGAPSSFAKDRSGGSADFSDDDRDIGDFAETRRTARLPGRAASAELQRPGGPDHRRAPDRAAVPGRAADGAARGHRRRDGDPAGARRGGART